MFFDTHAHYTSGAFNADRREVVASLPAAGIELVVCPAENLTNSRDCIALAEEFSHVYAAVGFHPHNASEWKVGDEDALRELSVHPKVVAIGEAGLDYHYDHSPREVQQDVFRRHMALARELSLPIIVHDREAHADCLSIVREFPDVRGVYHCYSGALEDAKVLIGLGWHLSFTGVITYPNARKSLEVIEWMPLDRLMLETDAPYLTPVPYRGKRNDSRHLPFTAEAVARVRGISVDEVAAVTTENGKRFFGI